MPLIERAATLWTNQNIVLYHGTTLQTALTIEAGKVEIRFGKRGRDFGPGFYTTTVERQARHWAESMAMQQSVLGEDKPAIVEFVVPRDWLARLHALAFVNGDDRAEDYWSFVWYCRNGATDHRRHSASHGYICYDVVLGPVTAFWTQNVVMPSSDQISFHTAVGEDLLNFSNKRVITW